VLTHHVPENAWPGITFVSDFAEAVRQAKEAAGDKYVNVLGADVARQCLAAGELDEVLTCVAPVLLGDGVRLFEQPGGRTVGLERIHLSGVPLASLLRFRVLPAG
jgi:dihydrofolate reductase